MAKPELGTKRLCAGCGVKFYDLNKDPIVCPKCGTVFEPMATSVRGRPGTAAAAPEEEALPETPEAAEFVSLEEADAEAQGGGPTPAADIEGEEDVEVDDESLDDAAFLETDEDEDEDVSDIIGEGIEPDEET